MSIIQHKIVQRIGIEEKSNNNNYNTSIMVVVFSDHVAFLIAHIYTQMKMLLHQKRKSFLIIDIEKMVYGLFWKISQLLIEIWNGCHIFSQFIHYINFRLGNNHFFKAFCTQKRQILYSLISIFKPWLQQQSFASDGYKFHFLHSLW